jgi:peptidoglycan DL-endopeptidase CwlO
VQGHRTASRSLISPRLLRALARTESRHNARAVSSKGALGAYQFMPETAQALGVDPLDPVQARAGAARLLRRYVRRYGDVRTALAAYVWGPGNVASGKPWPLAVHRYVERVLSHAGVRRADDAAVYFAELAP